MDLSGLDISSLDPATQIELANLVKQYEKLAERKKCADDFLEFVHHVWPRFIDGSHHKIMAEAFERIASGKLKRLIISMPPRHTKSEFASVHLPAWYLGKYPDRKVIQASHTSELAVGFGRKVRDLLLSPRYIDIFPDVSLKADTKAAGRWMTSEGGEYFAIGSGGAVTGKGADLFIIDDPHSEQEAAQAEFNPEIYDKTYEWFTSGPRQRLQPGGAIIIVMTRWSKRDLAGQVLAAQLNKTGTDQWEVIELPAILPSGKPLWPEFWSLTELESLKAELPVSKWNAQYQQNPTSDTGALIKRSWWKDWTAKTPPPCDIIMCSFDTAFGKTERSNYSACTTWGIFNMADDDTGENLPTIIMLDAWRDKLTFPQLKERAKNHYSEFKPDIMLVEKKSAGEPLIYELRAMGIPVSEYLPVKGNDKISRVNAITDIFASGRVYAPLGKRWAEEVVEECASFPAGMNDDYVDTVSQALLRFRQGGWIGTKNDDWDDDIPRTRKRVYY